MIIENLEQVTQAVLNEMRRTPDARTKEILESMVRHLHAFIREVKLTEKEFDAAINYVAALGQLTTESHNEVRLMCGSLGISTLICLMNNGPNAATESSANLLGPFWRTDSPRTENGGSLLRSSTPGPALFFKGWVRDQEGRPVAGAEVDIWHASPIGLYESQDPEQADMNLRGKFTTDDDGRFWFATVKMIGYPIPTDGVVGRLLRAQNRHPYRPAHLHALIVKEGFKVLISQVYDPEDPNIDVDPQFGVTKALLGDYVRHAEPHPTDPQLRPPWYSLDYTYVMEPGETKLSV